MVNKRGCGCRSGEYILPELQGGGKCLFVWGDDADSLAEKEGIGVRDGRVGGVVDQDSAARDL